MLFFFFDRLERRVITVTVSFHGWVAKQKSCQYEGTRTKEGLWWAQRDRKERERTGKRIEPNDGRCDGAS